MSTKKAGWIPGTQGAVKRVKTVSKSGTVAAAICELCGKPLVKRFRYTGKKKMKLVRACCEGV